VVIGGGQAGLAVSYHLRRRGIDHLVLEQNRIGHEWRENRWDSFCLVTPNWQCRLPGFPYRGDDPDGFMVREDIVRYIEDFAGSFDPPIAEGVAANGLICDSSGTFTISSSRAQFTASQVVVATGPYQTPMVPRMAERLPSSITQLHSSDYRNPDQLPDGEVLVIGTGQSGCQIAEDLHLAGRTVHVSVGSAPRIARFYRGRDVVAWLDDMGYYKRSIDEFEDENAVRARANHYVTGRDGGRDIDLRQFASQGMHLYGRMTLIHGPHLEFAADLASNLDNADQVAENIKNSIDEYVRAHGIDAPTEARYTPVWQPEQESTRLNLEGSAISTVIWSTGFRRDYRWIQVPVFDGNGYPTHHRGETNWPGLYFIGLPWQHTWGSGRFSGIADDADYVSERIVANSRNEPEIPVVRPSYQDRHYGYSLAGDPVAGG
jgi:putative flavoprotein involved in K+ transport